MPARRRQTDTRTARKPAAAVARGAISSPEKLLWPADGITKRDLAGYYTSVALALLPHLRDRPLVMKPFPNGITESFYYRQTLPSTAPEWLPRYQHIPKPGTKPNQMPLVDGTDALLWLVNQSAIEMHPWLSRIDAPEQPDYVVFDLDVLDEQRFPLALEVATLLRAAIEAEGMTAYPKTTGGDGVHVYVPIARGPRFEQTRAWALRLAEELRREHPKLITTESHIAGREDLVLIDYAQNALGKTTVAPYSVRPRPGAPVSMPLEWDEVAAGRVRPGDFTLRTAPSRLAARGDLFAPVLAGTANLPAV